MHFIYIIFFCKMNHLIIFFLIVLEKFYIILTIIFSMAVLSESQYVMCFYNFEGFIKNIILLNLNFCPSLKTVIKNFLIKTILL